MLEGGVMRGYNFTTMSEHRVVSLVPSLTETVAMLAGLGVLVGRTKFCVHPDGIEQAAIVGGTKNVDMTKVLALRPTMVLATKEENIREQVEAIERECPTMVFDIITLADVEDMILRLGGALGAETLAEEMVAGIRAALGRRVVGKPRLKVLYLIWRKPWMAAGGDTYISTILQAVGMHNVLAGADRYPALSEDQIRSLGADVILLSSEPFPFREAHAKELEIVFGVPCICVDGEAFSWYGARTAIGLEYGRQVWEHIPGL